MFIQGKAEQVWPGPLTPGEKPAGNSSCRVVAA